jgi:ATP-dependent DNA helicase RecG
MDAETLKKIIVEGESVEVELKQSFHSVQEIARIIAAFANTQGGLLILGVTDKRRIEGIKENPDIIQQKIAHANAIIHPAPLTNVEVHTLDHKKIILVVVHKADLSVFHSVEGVIFVRLGSTVQKLEGQSIIEFLRHRQILLFEESIEPTALLNDIDQNRVRDYLEKRKQEDFLKKHSLQDFFLNKKLASLQPDLKLKNAGLLFFSKDPQFFFPYTLIKLVRFDGKEAVKVLAYEEAKGTLPQMIEHSLNFIRRFIAKEFVIKDFKRKEILYIPEDAVRETIINALAHRDYFNKNEVQLSIFDDRVEITNPGGLPEGMTKELLGALSIQRNPKIYELLKDYGYMEGLGSGIIQVRELMKKNNLPEPEFLTNKEFFRIILRIRKFEEKRSDLTKRQIIIINYLKEHKKIKSKECAAINKISIPTAVNELKNLEKLGLVEKKGTYRGAYYVIKEEK